MRRTITIAATAALALGLVAGPATAKGGPPEADGTIYDIATAASEAEAEEAEFQVLTLLVDALGLDGVLDGRRQFTVFAPTDAAFGVFLADTAASRGISVEELVGYLTTTDEGKELATSILLYHVAPGERDSGDVTTSTQVNTLNGAKISVDGAVLDGTSNIIAVDIEASNGIIHVIDKVLMP